MFSPHTRLYQPGMEQYTPHKHAFMDTNTANSNTSINDAPTTVDPMYPTAISLSAPSPKSVQRMLDLQQLYPNLSFAAEDEDEFSGRAYRTHRDSSTYSVLPTGRLVAGSKRVARAKEAPLRDTVVYAKDLQFGDGDAGAGQGFLGFGVSAFLYV
ncbi:hypothetical protein H0H87_005336 [Tephrocybe sp. NHM501043]|nr:hypothetical protein H0H87_005336 [Tephrocybe sp. NHM501043]